MPDINAVIAKALPGLAKLGYEKYKSSRASFEQLARDVLTDILTKNNKNTRIVGKTVNNLLSDHDMQHWLNSAQFPDELTFEKLAGRVKLDQFVLQEFLLAFEKKVTSDTHLSTAKGLRTATDIAQSTQKTNKILEQHFEGPAQEHQRALDEYRNKARTEFSSIMLFGERTANEEENVFERMSDIRRGFVPLHLRHWLDDEDVGEHASPVEIEELFFNNRPRLMLIRGLPGGGKTTLLRYLAWRFANANDSVLPIYIRLKSLDLSSESLLDFIRTEVSTHWTTPAIDEALRHKDCFLETPMLVLLDGIDEIKSAASHAKFAEALNTLATKEKKRCHIIVTSRPIALKKEDYPEFTAYDLDRLTPEMITDYTQKWFGAEQDKIDLLQNILADKPRMRELAENPFLLSMICFAFDTKGGDAALINRRSALYAACTQRLLARMYRLDSDVPTQVQKPETLALLKDLALRFFLWQESEFPTDQVNVLGRRVLSTDDLNMPTKTLDDLQRTTGLIQRAQEGYTFVHRSLWEYFTASALHGKNDATFIIKHAANPDWEEVVRLYAGLLESDEDVKKLVAGLWQINKPLALRVSTEVAMDTAALLKPLIHQEGGGNQDLLLLIDFIAQSLPLVLGETARKKLVEETLRILFIDCEVTECEVLYHAQMLMEKQNMQPLEPGGLIYDLLELDKAAERQRNLLADPKNLFEWIEVEGSEFLMGDNEGRSDESPEHRVRLRSFRMMKHPVTNRLMKRAKFPFVPNWIINANDGSDKCPLIGATWFEAYYFSLFIGARLPTEAEWEFAARGGKGAPHQSYYFTGGADELSKHAWFNETGRTVAHEVDELNPSTQKENLNPLGLANMLGNVWDWCYDWYGNYESSDDVLENPIGPKHGNRRVLRGGACNIVADNLRCAFRHSDLPTNRGSNVGFRSVQDVSFTL